MGEGVEWALHTCLILAWLDAEAPVPVTRLAAAHELPAAYLNKQLQVLTRAGIVISRPGRRGGFRLARAPEKITLMDVVAAIEGTEEAFRCTEIRQRGLGKDYTARHFQHPCRIAAAMRSAELAWRRALAAQTIADLLTTTDKDAPGAAGRVNAWYQRTSL